MNWITTRNNRYMNLDAIRTVVITEEKIEGDIVGVYPHDFNPPDSFERFKSKLIEDCRKEILDFNREHPYRVKFRDMWIHVKNYIQSIPIRVKAFIQRGKRGWADCDTWGFDTYLAKVISEGVRYLKDNKTGYPLLNAKQPEEEWKDILNKIIKTFKTAEEISDGDIWYIPSNEYDEEAYNEILKTLAKDETLTKQESIEYEEGFDLFKKYFHNLWD